MEFYMFRYLDVILFVSDGMFVLYALFCFISKMT